MRALALTSAVVLAVLGLAAWRSNNARPDQPGGERQLPLAARQVHSRIGTPRVVKAGTSAPRRPHGIVVAECPTGGSPTIAFIDPATGATTDRLTPAGPGDNPPHLKVPDVCHPSLSLERQAFSPDFSREVATYTDEPDGSEHVGYVPLRTGVFVDITARTLGSDVDQPPVHDGDPVFSPDGTRLVWERDGRRLLSYHLANGQLYGAGDLPDEADLTARLQTNANAGSTGIVVSPFSGLAVLGSTAPSPSGAVAVGWSNTGADSRSLRVFTGTRGFTDTFRESVDRSYGRLVRVSRMPADNCGQLAWLDATTVLCAATRADPGGTSQLYALPLAPGARATTAKALLRANDRVNTSPVVSPDGSQLAFVSSRGDVATLSRTRVGHGRRVPISALPGDSVNVPVILAWLP